MTEAELRKADKKCRVRLTSEARSIIGDNLVGALVSWHSIAFYQGTQFTVHYCGPELSENCILYSSSQFKKTWKYWERVGY